MDKTKLVLFLAITLLGIGVAECADLTTYCSTYKDGELSFANGTVDGNKVDGAGCAEQSLSQVQFQFTSKKTNGPVSVVNASYDPATGTCNTTWIDNAHCVSKDNSTNLFTFQVSFTADVTTHPHQYLALVTDCVPSGGSSAVPYTSDFSRCDPIVVQAGSPDTSGNEQHVSTGLLGQLKCPDIFVKGRINVITYIIEDEEVKKAGCSSASNIVFDFSYAGDKSATPLCSQPYPPDTCDASVADNDCGCVKQIGGVYTYQFRFAVKGSHGGGQIAGSLCRVPKNTYDYKADSSCASVTFDDDNKSDSHRSSVIWIVAGVAVALWQ